jgi:hypothetical protein
MTIVLLGVGALVIGTGCGHHRHMQEQKMAAFEDRIAEKCAAAVRPSVYVLPRSLRRWS